MDGANANGLIVCAAALKGGGGEEDEGTRRRKKEEGDWIDRLQARSATPPI